MCGASTKASASTAADNGSDSSACSNAFHTLKETKYRHDSEASSSLKDSEPLWIPTKRFRLTFSLICFIFLLSAFEASVVGNVLPSVASDLRLGASYIWGSIAFLLASTIVQPFYAQIQDAFGRKWPLVMSISIFAVGSAFCGAAKDKGIFLTGRVIQGLGTSGVDLIGETIIGDLIPLRFRPKWFGIKQAVFAAGTLLGPVLGGVFTEKLSWRWVFYMNIPLCAASGLLIAFFLKLEQPPLGSLTQKLKKVWKMDLSGITMLAASLTLLTVSLTDPKVFNDLASIIQFVFGCISFVGFLLWETVSPYCHRPFIAARLWTKVRTSLIGFFNILVWGSMAYGTQLILPIHLQAVKGHAPMKAGNEMLPVTVLLVVFSGISGHLLSTFGSRKGVYKWIQLVGFMLQTIGSGIFITLNSKCSDSWLFVAMILFAMGSGIAIPAVLPSIVIELEDSDNAVATGNWAFLRNVGAVVGCVLPALYLNTETLQMTSKILDQNVREELLRDSLWNKASAEFLGELPDDVRPIVRNMFSIGLKWTFVTFTVASGVSALVTLLMKEMSMREHNDTAFGLQEQTLSNQEHENSNQQVAGCPTDSERSSQRPKSAETTRRSFERVEF